MTQNSSHTPSTTLFKFTESCLLLQLIRLTRQPILLNMIFAAVSLQFPLCEPLMSFELDEIMINYCLPFYVIKSSLIHQFTCTNYRKSKYMCKLSSEECKFNLTDQHHTMVYIILLTGLIQ